MLQGYTNAPVNCDIFCHNTNINITTRYRNVIFQQSEITVFYGSLPTSKPFQSYLLNKGTQEREKIPSLYCFACFQSRIFQDGSTKACTIPIICQLTQSCTSTDKTLMVHLFFAALLCLSVVYNDVSYHISCHGTN